MKILTRYILKEMFGPTVLGFAFYTSLILMRQLFDMAGMIISRSLAPAIVGKLLLLSLPNIVVLTVPMSLLFGILIAIGRLSSDSEIIAMRALGISTRTIYLPVFLFSFAVFLINLYLMNVVLPRGNSEFTKLRAEIFTSTVEKEIQPRRFYDDYENLMIYVNDIDPRTGEWKGVFVADTRAEENGPASAPLTPQQIADRAAREREEQQREIGAGALATGGGQRIVIAQGGNLAVQKNTNQVWMNLRNANTHVMDPRRPDRYDLNRNAVQRILLPDKYASSDIAGQYAKSLREMDLKELFRQEQMLRAVTSKTHATEVERQTYNLARVEIHKKFAIPFACIVFGILGLPLGITNRRGGKSSGFSLSIGIILFYYVMINNGEALARTGRVSPLIGMWTPNLLLLVIGIYLLGRANRETGAQKREAGWIQRAIGAVTSRRAQRRQVGRASESRRGSAEPDEPPILKRLDITFPNILDRYILREFLKTLALVLISTAALFTVIDYTGIASDIRENHIPLHMVLAYYRFSFFSILNWTLPISVLVATLVTFGILSKNNEVTAFKSGGVSLYRAALPVVVVAGAISLLAYLNLDFVLPYANQRANQIHNKIKGSKVIQTAGQQRLWFVGKGRYIINFLSYDNNTRQVAQIQVFEFHPTEFRMTRRVYADRAKWDGRGWVFSGGWIRSFTDEGSTTYTPIANPIRLYYQETPQDFALEGNSDPTQMTFNQLRRYIESLKKTGYAAEKLSVQLYSKTSWPFLSMVMALIALPFAFRIGKRGALYGVGIALVVGIFYWMVYAVFTKFGEVGNLPPILSAWSANILFAIAAVYLFLHAET